MRILIFVVVGVVLGTLLGEYIGETKAVEDMGMGGIFVLEAYQEHYAGRGALIGGIIGCVIGVIVSKGDH